MNRPVVLVTGASSGIGKLAVQALAPHADIHAASRGRCDFGHENVRWLRMDVRDPVSVREGIERVHAESGRLDAVVANAGVMLAGLIEETTLEQARDLFDTNFWGVAQVVSAALPAMRAQRSGQIVITGSLAGRVGTPGQGFYAAAKFALEGYAETLATEVQAFGIRVNLVEPGFHRTDLHQRCARGALHVADYDGVRSRVEDITGRNIAQGADPQQVADLIARLVRTSDTGLRHPVGTDARWVPRLKALVPEGMFLQVLRRKFGLVG